MSPSRLVVLVTAAWLSACATAPGPLRGEFSAVAPASGAVAQGQRVRWGGSLIAAEPRAGETCFEVLARPLSESGRPYREDQAEGRFLACRPGFYDPALFDEGREVTFTGTVQGFETRRIGEYDYRYPLVAADVVYLWPPRREVEYIYAYDPWLSHWGPWWGYRLHHHPPLVRRRSPPG